MGKTLSLPVRIKVSDERHIKANPGAALKRTFSDQFDNKDFTVSAARASHVYFVFAKVKDGQVPHGWGHPRELVLTDRRIWSEGFAHVCAVPRTGDSGVR